MASKTVALAKRNPVMTMLISAGSLAVAITAIWNFGGLVDRSVVTHAELTQIFSVHSASAHDIAQTQINLIRQESKCGSIDIQIAILSDVIWRLEQSEPDGQRLMEKRADMIKLKERRTALECAKLA